MGTPTLTLMFDRRKRASKTKEGNIELRITFNRVKRYVTTGVRVFPREWKNGAVVNRLDAYELQRTLDQFVAHARKVINNLMERGELDMQRIVATPIGADNRREAKAKQSTFTVRCKRGEEPRFFDKWATVRGDVYVQVKERC